MSIKKYFTQQFQLRSFLLQHDVASDFYLSSFQRNRSPTPMLIIRTLIFAGCLAIWVASMVLTTWDMPIRYWPIYMTHWGLIMNTAAAGFGLIVSVVAFYKLPTDASLGLPWYTQIYWAMFNLATPIAFFITVFYWGLLSGIEQDFAINLTLDIFVHAVNSVLMCAVLFSSRHPTYFLHFYMPVGFAIVYLIFSYIYYATGGIDAHGEHAIYPMIDWEKPGETMVMVVICAIGIIILHALVVALSAGRDALSKRFRKETTIYDIHKSYY